MGLTKEQFDRLYIGKGLAVNCDTEEKANEFLKLADSFGYMWGSGKRYIKYCNWEYYKSNTIYCIKNGTFENMKYTRDKKIVSYPQHPIQFTKSDLKSGDKVVYRNGTERYVLIETETLHSIVTGDKSTLLKYFNDNLYWEETRVNSNAIMKVYRNNELIWERVEEPVKTPQQIELEKIEIRQRELAEEQKKLADRINELSK